MARSVKSRASRTGIARSAKGQARAMVNKERQMARRQAAGKLQTGTTGGRGGTRVGLAPRGGTRLTGFQQIAARRMLAQEGTRLAGSKRASARRTLSRRLGRY